VRILSVMGGFVCVECNLIGGGKGFWRINCDAGYRLLLTTSLQKRLKRFMALVRTYLIWLRRCDFRGVISALVVLSLKFAGVRDVTRLHVLVMSWKLPTAMACGSPCAHKEVRKQEQC